MNNKIKVGAVIYDPKVTIIWGIIADFFAKEGSPIECLYFKNYKDQVDSLLSGEIDIAWNSPLAWLDAFLRTEGKCLNGSMRDTDQNRKTYLLVKRNGPIKKLEDLKGKTIGFGAVDSPQARLIPINFLHKNGLEHNKDYVEKIFNIGVGLHGDHIGGELDGVKALITDEVDGAFTLDLNWEAWQKDGTIDANELVPLANTDLFDHCIFTGRPDFSPELFKNWEEVLHKMDYSNPDHKAMMDMEGLKKWVFGRTEGFAQITEANEYLKFFNY